MLILASASPPRAELLRRLGFPFDVLPVDVDESLRPNERPDLAVRRLAREKAEAARLLRSDAAVLAADTVVVLDGMVLGKPADAREALEMLLRLRGREHEVITAVAMLLAGETAALVRHPSTVVRMRDYSDDEIATSIARGDPFDKAGAYAIQDPLFAPVQFYEGCYCNVVGLPLWSSLELLRKAGIDVSHVRAEHLLPQCAQCPLRP